VLPEVFGVNGWVAAAAIASGCRTYAINTSG